MMRNRGIVNVFKECLEETRHRGTDEFRDGVRAGVVRVLLAFADKTSSPTLRGKLMRVFEEDQGF